MSTPRPDWRAQVDPELASLLRMLPSLTFTPFTTRLFRALEALLPSRPLPAGVEHRVERIGGQRLHLYAPSGGVRSPGALLYIHGGGLLTGHPKHSARAFARIVESLGALVVATEYRHAPEHPYPAAIDDCRAAWGWLLDRAAGLGVDPGRIVVGGDSAGGGLAACLAQRLYDEGGAQPAGQLLIYPMLDDRTAIREELTGQGHLVWNNRSNHYGWSSYLARPPGEPDAPPYAAAARRGDLSGLPATWMTVGTLDLFFDEDCAYAERLRAAGSPVELDVVEGGFHGYFTVGTDEPPIARMWGSIERFLGERFAAPG